MTKSICGSNAANSDRNSDNAAALFNLGMSLGDAGESTEALEKLQQLVTTEPGYPCGHPATGTARLATAVPKHRDL